jgi:outer membrane protein assembly factor BamA
MTTKPLRISLAGLLLAAPGAFGQGTPMPALPAIPAQALLGVEIRGGSGDDHAFAQAALGFKAGDPVGEEGFLLGLAAVRATDRFRTVEGRLEAGPKGPTAWIQLDPWPELRQREIRGAIPKGLQNNLFPGMHKGGRAGDLRLQQWKAQAEQTLKEAGYPQATVRITRQDAGARVLIEVDSGAPLLVRSIVVEGDPFPYSFERLKGVAGVQEGKSIWTETLQRNALNKLRQRLVKDQRLEGTVDFQWDEKASRLTIRVQAGPLVQLRHEGDWSLWWKKLNDLVPLARAGSYNPELMDEGDRRILRFLRDKGYLDAKVSHRREVLRGTSDNPLEVAVTYVVEAGAEVRIHGLRFQRNQDIPEAELQKAAGLPSGIWSLGDPPATPDLISSLEDRIKAYYWNHGYPDAVLRRLPMEQTGGKTYLVFQVREGAHQALAQLVLTMPADPSWQPWKLAEALPLIFSGQVKMVSAPDDHTRLYRSDRPALQGITGTLQECADAAKPGLRVFTFTTSEPIAFVKNDLAVVFTSLRQRVGSLGVQAPMPRLRLEPSEAGYRVNLDVPDQPRDQVRRLVVQGSDQTKARAVFRETQLEPGAPLDAVGLSKAQTNLGDLGAFQRTDLMSLKDAPVDGAGLPWRAGDLLLRADERPPWVLGSSFSYDKSYGYSIGTSAQRQNFMGMGRTLDFGMRVGNTTLQNPTLRKWFPTGDFNRSLDSFSIGYTDPWFLPGALDNILSPRTQYRGEVAFIEDTQAAFQANRRRMLNSLEWKIGDAETVQLGHRFERTDIKANLDGIDVNELFTMAGVPGAQTIISAPFLQVTVDRRDHPLDPKRGTYFMGRLELANQLFGTGVKYSFVKLDLRHQWNWPIGGEDATRGVFMASARLGLARPTAASVDNLPLAERFFAGGPFTVRGVEPDFLGPVGTLGVYQNVNGTGVQTGTQMIPLGGQGLVVLNLEYRFPLFGSQTVWAELFADSGQVYAKLIPGPRQPGDSAPFPPLRTTLGLGLILKLGLPIKFEYAADYKRIMGQPRTQQEIDTELRGLLISAGYQY